jgi:Zn-finger nucleic acid-binding protein
MLSRKNGHNLKANHEPWVNALFEIAAGLAIEAATFLWIYDRLLDKRFVESSRQKMEIRVMQCPGCSTAWADSEEVKKFTATAWAHTRAHELIDSGRAKEAVAEAMNEKFHSALTPVIERILQEKTIKSAGNPVRKCPFCVSSEIKATLLVLGWKEAFAAVQHFLALDGSDPNL